jgi:hypothetical protein
LTKAALTASGIAVTVAQNWDAWVPGRDGGSESSKGKKIMSSG